MKTFAGLALILVAIAPVAAAEPVSPPLGAVVTVVPAAAPTKYKSDIICTSTVETGSLIKRHKVCLTQKQRDYLSDQNEREARRLVHDNQGLQTTNGP